TAPRPIDMRPGGDAPGPAGERDAQGAPRRLWLEGGGLGAHIGWLAMGAAVGLCVAPTFAQENGSLSDAFAFIQRSITAQGQLSQTDQIRDSSNNQAWVENWTMLYENADYDTAACTLKFHA